jgi:hypothetical protein
MRFESGLVWLQCANGSIPMRQKEQKAHVKEKMLMELSGSATSDVASGSTHSLQDARNPRRSAIGSSLRDSNSNIPLEKTESSAIDPLSQVSPN